eukprot:s3687_g4.t1
MDVLLYCSKIGTEAVVYCNSITEFQKGLPASEFLKDRLRIIDNDLKEYKNWCFEQMDSVDPNDGHLLDPLMNLITARSGKIENFKTLTRRLHHTAKLYPVGGTPDGNCGIYMLLSLLSKQGAAGALQSTCVSAADTDPGQMMAMRQDLAMRRPGAGIAIARPTTGPSVLSADATPPRVKFEKPDVVKIVKVELSPPKIKVEPAVAAVQIKAEPMETEESAERLDPEDDDNFPEIPDEDEGWDDDGGGDHVPEFPAEYRADDAPVWDWGDGDRESEESGSLKAEESKDSKDCGSRTAGEALRQLEAESLCSWMETSTWKVSGVTRTSTVPGENGENLQGEDDEAVGVAGTPKS